MDAATFRQNFPEFADTARFSDAQVNFWLTLGEKLLRADRWSDLLDSGLSMFAAHNLVLGERDQTASAGGASPGASSGPVASKSVDNVSVSYATGSFLINDGGAWNLTTYGVRFLQLARLVGAGGLQL